MHLKNTDFTFAEATEHAEAEKYENLSVLLGNGLSMDYDPDIFAYKALAAKAEFNGLSIAKEELLKKVNSDNLETIVESLQLASRLVQAYGIGDKQASRLEEDAEIVRNELAHVLARLHPPRSAELTQAEITQASKFLAHFDHIFTLNYDMLLYWVLARSNRKPDGFYEGDDNTLVWGADRRQNLHYLHGAFHLFTSGNQLTKLRARKNGPLIEALQERLNRNEFPLVVTEGNSDEKRGRIQSSEYLRVASARFYQTKGALFIHGVSLDSRDDHIFKAISGIESEIRAVYVGLHESSSEIVRERVLGWQRIREKSGSQLDVSFYKAETAQVWRE